MSSFYDGLLYRPNRSLPVDVKVFCFDNFFGRHNYGFRAEVIANLKHTGIRGWFGKRKDYLYIGKCYKDIEKAREEAFEVYAYLARLDEITLKSIELCPIRLKREKRHERN